MRSRKTPMKSVTVSNEDQSPWNPLKLVITAGVSNTSF